MKTILVLVSVYIETKMKRALPVSNDCVDAVITPLLNMSNPILNPITIKSEFKSEEKMRYLYNLIIKTCLKSLYKKIININVLDRIYDMFINKLQIIPHTNIEYLYVFFYFNIVWNNKIVGLNIAIDSINAGFTELIEYVSNYYTRNYDENLFVIYNTIGFKHNIITCVYRLYRYYTNRNDTKNTRLMYKTGHKINASFMMRSNIFFINYVTKNVSRNKSLMNLYYKQKIIIEEQKKQINILNNKLNTTIPISIIFPPSCVSSRKNANTIDLTKTSIIYNDDDDTYDNITDAIILEEGDITDAIEVYNDISYDEKDDVSDKDYINC